MIRSAATEPNLRPRHRPGCRIRSSTRTVRPRSLKSVPIAHLAITKRTSELTGSEAKEEPKTPCFWIAQYLYPGPDGETRLVVRKIRAKDRESAEAVALKGAPAQEFCLTLVPESDDQFLGQVRHRALAAKARRS